MLTPTEYQRIKEQYNSATAKYKNRIYEQAYKNSKKEYVDKFVPVNNILLELENNSYVSATTNPAPDTFWEFYNVICWKVATNITEWTVEFGLPNRKDCITFDEPDYEYCDYEWVRESLPDDVVYGVFRLPKNTDNLDYCTDGEVQDNDGHGRFEGGYAVFYVFFKHVNVNKMEKLKYK